MRLAYYGYGFKHIQSSANHAVGLDQFLSAFCAYQNIEFKNSFSAGADKQFLLRHGPGLYLFLQTRDDELIKKIETESLTVHEVVDDLGQTEHLGFASYVYVTGNMLAYASTAMAPKVKAFGDFINRIILALGVSDHVFVLWPFLKQITQQEALECNFIGRTSFEVSKDSTLVSAFAEFFGASVEDFDDVGSIVVTIKPQGRRDISIPVKQVIRQVPQTGLQKFTIRAKDDLHGALVDHYLTGKGAVYDEIDIRKENMLVERIADKIEANRDLREALREYEHSENYSQAGAGFVFDYSNVDSWRRRFDGVRDAFSARIGSAAAAVSE